jgi:hypothetical protein
MMAALAFAKKILPRRARAVLRSTAEWGSAAADRALELVGRKGLKVWRSVHLQPGQEMDIAMLCIRKPVYVDMAVPSINSLHYRNYNIRVLLHLDPVCFDRFLQKRRSLDYAAMVQPILVEDNSAVPWQFTKLDVVLAVSALGVPFVDADSRWHGDPRSLIQRDRAMFLVKVNRICEIQHERLLVEEGLGRPEWIDFIHFNTGFISIPRDLCSEGFARECRSICRSIYAAVMEVQLDDPQRMLLRHTSEELSLSLVAQDVIGRANIGTLKEQDGPGNRNRLESYYYGALHGSS